VRTSALSAPFAERIPLRSIRLQKTRHLEPTRSTTNRHQCYDPKMIYNRSIPTDTVLLHRDVDDAAWLTRVFGFQEHYRYSSNPTSGAQMVLGKAVIMMNRPKDCTASPGQLGFHTKPNHPRGKHRSPLRQRQIPRHSNCPRITRNRPRRIPMRRHRPRRRPLALLPRHQKHLSRSMDCHSNTTTINDQVPDTPLLRVGSWLSLTSMRLAYAPVPAGL
jgi:hypothetical protein